LAEVVEDTIQINQDIQFEFNSDVLLEVSNPILDAVRLIMEQNPNIAQLVIEGHASYEGSVGYNYELSTRRAHSVLRYLVEAGINMNRFSYRGMGEAVPREQGADEASLAENRRVEFHITKWLDPEKDEIPDWQAIKPPIPWMMAEPEGDNWRPPTNEDGTQPAPNEEGSQPVPNEEGSQPPVNEEGTQPPVNEEGAQPPADNESGETP